MRKSIWLSGSLLVVVAFIGCQSSEVTNVNSSNAATTNRASNTNTTSSTPVSAASPSPTAAPTSNLKPADINLNQPVPAQELRNAFFADQNAWKGKQVAVKGSYHSHTTSTTSSGKTIRIDIADEKGKRWVACNVTTEPSAEAVKERNNWVVKGTIKETWFDQVLLEPCEVTK